MCVDRIAAAEKLSRGFVLYNLLIIFSSRVSKNSYKLALGQVAKYSDEL